MKKLLALITVAVMSAALLVSCTSGVKDGNDSAPATTKAVIMGLDDHFPPMGFRDEKNEIVGFDVDVAREVCARLNYELRLQPIKWEMKETELNAKNVDFLWNGYTITDARKKLVDFSKPYMTNTQVVVVLASSTVQTLDDLAGKTIGLQNGSTAEDAVKANAKFKDSIKGEPVKLDNNVTAMLDLGNNNLDAVIMDEVVARYYTTKNEGKFRVLEESLSDEQFGVGFRKDDPLKDEFQAKIDEMAKDGKLAEICEKWMGKDITLKD